MVSIDTNVDTDRIKDEASDDSGGGGSSDGGIATSVTEDVREQRDRSSSGGSGSGGGSSSSSGGGGRSGGGSSSSSDGGGRSGGGSGSSGGGSSGSGGGRAGDVNTQRIREEARRQEAARRQRRANRRGGGRASGVSPADIQRSRQRGVQQREERIRQQQGHEADRGDHATFVVRDPETGRRTSRTTREIARDMETRVVQTTPWITSRDQVAIERDGRTFRAEITGVGRERSRQIALDLERNVSSPAGGTESIRGGTPQGEATREDVVVGAMTIPSEPAGGPESVRGGTPEGAATRRDVAVGAATREPSQPAGGPESVRGGTPGGEAGRADVGLARAPDLPSRPAGGTESIRGGTRAGEAQPRVETETIGAAGPMGVTVPADRDRGVNLAAGAAGLAGWVMSRPVQEPSEPVDPTGPTFAPAGAPGAGNLMTADVPAAQQREDFGALRDWVESRPRMETTEPVDPTDPTVVPAGAPGVGVPSGQGQTVREDAERVVDAFTQPLPTGEAPPVVVPEGAPGVGVQPGGASAAEREQFVQDLGRVADGLTQPLPGGEPATAEVPAGAPGVGVPSGQGQPARADAASVGAFAGSVGERLGRPLPTGEAPPVDVPEGAPGVGVMSGREQPPPGTDFLDDVREALEPGRAPPRQPTEPTVPEGAPGTGNLMTAEVSAEQQREDFERGAEAVTGAVVSGAEAVSTDPEAPGAGNLVTTDVSEEQLERDVEAVREAAGRVRPPSDFEPGTPPGRLETQVDPLSQAPPTADPVVGDEVSAWAEEIVVPADQPPAEDAEPEQFGDAEWVAAGIDFERTAENLSDDFRDRTESLAKDVTDDLGLEEGSAEDVATETFIQTFPEIFNVGGLAAEGMELAELGGFVAGDPRRRGSMVAEEAELRAAFLARHFQENPAEFWGTAASIGVQLPLSLATLRGVSAVSPTAGRALDVVWNTPERVARRTLGRTDTPAFAEVRALRRQFGRGAEAEGRAGRAAARSRRAVREREAGLTRRSMRRQDADLYNFAPGVNRAQAAVGAAADEVADIARRTTVRGRPGMGAGGFEIEVEPRARGEADAGEPETLGPEAVDPDFGTEPPLRPRADEPGDVDAAARRREARRTREAEDEAFDRWREAQERELVQDVDTRREVAERTAADAETEVDRLGRFLTAEASAGVVQGERARVEEAQQPFFVGGDQDLEAQATGQDVLTAESEATTAGAASLVTGLGMTGLGTDFRTEARLRGETELGVETAAEVEQRLGVESDQEVEQELGVELEVEQETGLETETRLEQELEQEFDQELEAEPEPEFELELEFEREIDVPRPEPGRQEPPPDAREQLESWGQFITNTFGEPAALGITVREEPDVPRTRSGEPAIEITGEPDRSDEPAIEVLTEGDDGQALAALTGLAAAPMMEGSFRDRDVATSEDTFRGGGAAGAEDTFRPGDRGQRDLDELRAAVTRLFGGGGGRGAAPPRGGQRGQGPAPFAAMAQAMGVDQDAARGQRAPPGQPARPAGPLAGLGAFMGGLPPGLGQGGGQAPTTGGEDPRAELEAMRAAFQNGGAPADLAGLMGQGGDVQLVPEFDFEF